MINLFKVEEIVNKLPIQLNIRQCQNLMTRKYDIKL